MNIGNPLTFGNNTLGLRQYSVAATAVVPPPPNLVSNGDFELGDTGFTTSYASKRLDFGEKVYNITVDPNNTHSSAASYGDHTSGSGLMMAVNGSTSGGDIVWSQTINVTPNQTHNFSMYVSSWFPVDPARLRVYVNGTSIGSAHAPATTGIWQLFSATFNPGAASTANIEIREESTAAGGNDYALDDIQVTLPPMPPELPARWELNEGAGTTANDSIGTAIGTLLNDADWTTDTPGGSSSALDLNPGAVRPITKGTGDFVNFGDVLDAGTGDLTVALWYKARESSSSAGPQVLLVKGLTGGKDGYELLLNAGKLRWDLQGSGITAFDTTTSEPSLNVWHHVAGVLNRSTNTALLYLDGVEVNSKSVSVGNLDNSVSLGIGALNRESLTGLGETEQFFNGSIDDVHIIDRALTLCEIRTLSGRSCDTAAPAVVITTPPDGAIYDHNEVVNAAYSCTDESGGSGIASCVGDVANGAAIDTATLGANTFTVTGTDNVGNNTVVTHNYTVVDVTDPGVTITTPPDGAIYDHNEVVNAAYACTDESGGSGIASCVGDVANGAAIDTATLGAKTFTVTGTDNVGNNTVVTHNYTVVDVTDPGVTITTPPDGAIYDHNEVVNAAYACSDEAGGSGIAFCVGDVADGSAIDTATLGAKTFTVTGTDNASNVTVVTHNYTVVDVTDPVVTITTPPDGAIYVQGEVVLADYDCTDEVDGSGIASCVGDVAAGAAIDTASVGAKTFTVTGTDNASNDTVVANNYTVIGAQGLKNGAIADLTPFEGESKKIKKAIKEISKSLEKGFVDETHLDPKHGKKVFDHEKHAVKELMKVIKDEDKGKDKVSDDAEAAVRQAIIDLVTADRLLATVQLDEVQSATVLDPNRQAKVDKEIAKALKEMDKAGDELAKGHDDHAIGKYKKAWEHATHALKEAAKAP